MADETPPVSPADDEHSAAEYFDTYTAYSATLRIWLVTYGVGGPVLFVSNKDLYGILKDLPGIRWVVLLFFAGGALQVLIAVLNKWLNWSSYAASVGAMDRKGWVYRWTYWLVNQWWIDLLFDVASVGSFGVATAMIIINVT